MEEEVFWLRLKHVFLYLAVNLAFSNS